MKRIKSCLGISAAILLLSASSCDPLVSTAGKSIKDCAANDLIGSGQIVYMGPVGVGPGSRWIKLNNDLTTIAADVTDIFSPPVPDFYAPPPPVGSLCELSTTKKTDLGLALGVSVSTLPVSADLKTKIGNSAKVSTTVDGFEWRAIKLDVYNNFITALPDASPYKRPGPGRLTAVAMLKVKGYTATVELASSTDLGLGVGYTGPLPAELLGKVKTDVTATVTSTGKLVLSVPGESYVAAILRPVNGSTGKTESASKDVKAQNEWEVRTADVKGSRR